MGDDHKFVNFTVSPVTDFLDYCELGWLTIPDTEKMQT